MRAVISCNFVGEKLAWRCYPFTVSKKVETHTIKQLQQGVYWTLLEWPTSELLPALLRDTHRYVWCHNHEVGNFTWRPFVLPLALDTCPQPVISRLARFDFILPVTDFLRVLPQLHRGIHVVQLNRLPADYLDLDRIKGPERYRLLSEAEWLFEFNVPGNDYGELASCDRTLLETAIACVNHAP